jgi:hypothetical protein
MACKGTNFAKTGRQARRPVPALPVWFGALFLTPASASTLFSDPL